MTSSLVFCVYHKGTKNQVNPYNPSQTTVFYNNVCSVRKDTKTDVTYVNHNSFALQLITVVLQECISKVKTPFFLQFSIT